MYNSLSYKISSTMKNSGVVYQSSSNETEKFIWLAGDFNIDLLNENKKSQRRYKDILHLFSLRQHITKARNKEVKNIDRSWY